MVSRLHELQLELFRNRPALVAELLHSALGQALPRYTGVRSASADLTNIRPAEFRADGVVYLTHDDASVMGVVVEIQLAPDEQKRFSWPSYAINLRSRLKRPVCLFVVALDETVARWASQPIDLGGGNVFVPTVLGPSVVPKITDEACALENPERATLSVVAHGHDADIQEVVRIAQSALAACRTLDEDRYEVYFELLDASISEVVREELKAMKTVEYECISPAMRQARAAARLESRIELIRLMLTSRFGTLSPETQAQLGLASIEQLDAIGGRLLTAKTLQQALQL